MAVDRDHTDPFCSIIQQLISARPGAIVSLLGESLILAEDEAIVLLRWVIRVVGTWSWQIRIVHLLLPNIFAFRL